MTPETRLKNLHKYLAEALLDPDNNVDYIADLQYTIPRVEEECRIRAMRMSPEILDGAQFDDD